jgi:hypothetical protein
LNEYQESHDGNEGGVNNPGTEISHRGPFTVWFENRKHQDSVSGITSDSAQPEQSAHGQQRATRGNSRKLIRRTKNGLNKKVPRNADNHSREVQHPDDSCSRPEVIAAESIWRCYLRRMHGLSPG